MMKTAELCRSRRVLENDTLIAKIGADTAANEPPKDPKTGYLYLLQMVILVDRYMSNLYNGAEIQYMYIS